MKTPRYWQSCFPACLLLPLAWLFGAVATLRRLLFRSGMLRRTRLTVPVVVVGNLSAGGAGKTPTVRYLAERMRMLGWRPGIVCRGYGGSEAGCAQVNPQGLASRYGDEPLLLARTCACPVFVGRDRVAAAQTLLAAHPSVNLIITDDGLQHYRLARDIEIVVIDGSRGLQNGWLLPAGPLREPASRLNAADALLINGPARAALPSHPQTFAMQLEAGALWQLGQPDRRCSLADLRGQRVAALAGIAHPDRFFTLLREAGLQIDAYPFADHYAYRATDLAPLRDTVIVTTEKDAVKLAALQHNGSIWVVPVAAQLTPDLAAWLDARLHALRSPHGHQAA
ncbi:tetraacyldisaccharide 4'-kinase [Chitinimonas sp.]|uniref:tetraacyldisaccharide 4'-kinase n=1 Tax=Chitinimonas sp. TaxID=1934313 RepID=UPI0035B16E59